MNSTVTSKGRITLPARLREALRLGPGSVIDWVVDDTGLLIGRVVTAPHLPFQAALGTVPLPDGQSTEDVMLEIRGERDQLDRGGPGARLVSLSEVLKRFKRRPCPSTFR